MAQKKTLIITDPSRYFRILQKYLKKKIKKRLISFLTKYSVLSDKQFGFREKMSTENAILQLTNYLYDNLDKSKPSLCIFVDLSKAFDTVDHDDLLKRLYSYGIRGVAYELIKSYLSNRKQLVAINNVKSNFKQITCGVPQGTVLGPLLFILYVNDLLKMSTLGQIISYADDTAIFYSGDSWDSVKVKESVAILA